jgi:SAM-dependent methyltransferase
MAITPNETENIVRRVQDDYTRIAEQKGTGEAACTSCHGYRQEELEALPGDADMGLGCGAPVAALDLHPGETVLDLGSGGGIDVFLAADRVGPTGRVIGVDMTPAMIELARKNAREGGYDNVEFRRGRLEALPLDEGSVDAVTSNCVINLVPDKAAVYGEIARVLRSGGRLVISDIVLDGALPAALLPELAKAGSCIVTASLREDYLDTLREAGLVEVALLRDVDYLATVGWTSANSMNEESRALLERTGVSFDELRGKVRSITVSAKRPA